MGDLKIATWNISCGIPAEWSFTNGIKKENDSNYSFCYWDDEGFFKQIELLKDYRSKLCDK